MTNSFQLTRYRNDAAVSVGQDLLRGVREIFRVKSFVRFEHVVVFCSTLDEFNLEKIPVRMH